MSETVPDWMEADWKTLGEMTDRKTFDPHIFKWVVYVNIIPVEVPDGAYMYEPKICIGMFGEGAEQLHRFWIYDTPNKDMETMEKAADLVRRTFGVEHVIIGL